MKRSAAAVTGTAVAPETTAAAAVTGAVGRGGAIASRSGRSGDTVRVPVRIPAHGYGTTVSGSAL